MSVTSFDPKQKATVGMSEQAQRFIAKEIAKKSAAGIRFFVERSGCSGFRYKLDFVDQANEDDINIAINQDITLYVNPDDQSYLNGTVIDLVTEGLNRSIQFLNPNASGTCGCGESFAVEP